MIYFFAILVAIILLIATLKYPSLSFVFFLTAGIFKTYLQGIIPIMQQVDFTVVCVILLMLSMMYSYVKNGRQFRDILSLPLGLYVSLILLLFFSLGYTSAPNYGFAKTWRFASVGFIAFFAPIVFTRTAKDLKPIIWIVFIAAVTFAVFTIAAPRESIVADTGWERAGFMGVGVLGTAVRIAMGGVIAFCFAVMPSTPVLLRMTCVALGPLMLIGIVSTGSRGPLVGFAFCVMIGLFIYRKYTSKVLLLLMVPVFIVVTGVFIVRMPEERIARFTTVFEGPGVINRLTSSRMVRFTWTLQNFGESPVIGKGAGSWAVDWGGGDEREYAHNMVLEVLYEQGLLGAILIVWFIWLVFKRWRHASKFVIIHGLDIGIFQIVHISGLLFLLTFLEAMKTGDINDNRLMFFCAGIAFAAFRAVETEYYDAVAETEMLDGDWYDNSTCLP